MLDLKTLPLDRMLETALLWGGNGAWALAILVVGWLVAGWGERAVAAALARVRVADAMLRGFFSSLVRWAVLAVTGVAVLERLGVQTTSVVAIMGAAGLAVGLALQGTLSNLAAGVMLLLFRPFTVGNTVEGAGLSGTVKAVTLFHTHLITGENVLVIVPNSTLWSASLRNLSALDSRKVDITVLVPYGLGADTALTAINTVLAADSRIAASPAPVVLVSKFTEKQVEITVSVWCAAGDAPKVKSDLMLTLWRDYALTA